MRWQGRSRGRAIAALASLVGLVAADLAAQPQRDRRVFAHVMQLRHRVWAEARGADAEIRAAVARLLAEDRSGNPLLPLRRAQALLRGVDADAAFLWRGGLLLLATPEVPDATPDDPAEAMPHFPDVHLTMHLPFPIAEVGAMRFDLRVLDAEGEERWRGQLAADAVTDLRQFSTTTTAPLAELEDGSYRVAVDAFTGDEGPRPGDPVATAEFHVKRGFPEAALALQRRFEALSVDDRSARLLRGALAGLSRVFYGEPAAGRSRPLDELARAEAMLDNAERGRPVLDGLRGWVTVAVRTGDDETGQLALRLPADDTPRPLVLFVPGTPAWDPHWRRPTSPRSTAPQWLAEVLEAAEFDAEGEWHLAVLQSPGDFASAPGAITEAVAELRALLPVAGGVVLAGERDGAVALSLAMTRAPELARAVVLAGGGGLPVDLPESVARTSWLLLEAVGESGNENLQRAAKYLSDAGAEVRLEAAGARPWAWPLAHSLAEIAAFTSAALAAPARSTGR